MMGTIRQHVVERRRHPRTVVQMTLRGIRLDPDGGEVTDTLRLLDISRSGMGCLSDRGMYPGQRMVLPLPLSDAGGRRNIYATVRRCRATETGFHVGLEFDNASRDTAVGGAAALAA